MLINRGTSMYRYIDWYRNYRKTGITLSTAYTPLKSHISGINILCSLRFAKICTRENKDPSFDHKIAKFDTRKNVRLYGMFGRRHMHSSECCHCVSLCSDWEGKGPCTIVPLTWKMAHKSLCRMIRNGPLKISKSLKKSWKWPIWQKSLPNHCLWPLVLENGP